MPSCAPCRRLWPWRWRCPRAAAVKCRPGFPQSVGRISSPLWFGDRPIRDQVRSFGGRPRRRLARAAQITFGWVDCAGAQVPGPACSRGGRIALMADDHGRGAAGGRVKRSRPPHRRRCRPLAKAAVRGQDHRAALVTGVDQWKNRLPRSSRRQIADSSTTRRPCARGCARARANYRRARLLHRRRPDRRAWRSTRSCQPSPPRRRADGQVTLAVPGGAQECTHCRRSMKSSWAERQHPVYGSSEGGAVKS